MRSPPGPARVTSTWPGATGWPGRTRTSLDRAGRRGAQLALGDARPRQLALGAQREQRPLGRGVGRIAQPVDELQLDLALDAGELGRLLGAVEADQDLPRLDPLAARRQHLADRARRRGPQVGPAAEAHHGRAGGVLADRAEHAEQQGRDEHRQEEPVGVLHPAGIGAQEVPLDPHAGLVDAQRLLAEQHLRRPRGRGLLRTGQQTGQEGRRLLRQPAQEPEVVRAERRGLGRADDATSTARTGSPAATRTGRAAKRSSPSAGGSSASRSNRGSRPIRSRAIGRPVRATKLTRPTAALSRRASGSPSSPIQRRSRAGSWNRQEPRSASISSAAAEASARPAPAGVRRRGDRADRRGEPALSASCRGKPERRRSRALRSRAATSSAGIGSAVR